MQLFAETVYSYGLTKPLGHLSTIEYSSAKPKKIKRFNQKLFT
jgi:hypothetical protein